MPTGAVFEGGYTVDNGANPHNADFYLGKAKVGTAVGETLGISAASSRSAARTLPHRPIKEAMLLRVASVPG
jgi:hypothetical protein